MASESLIRLGPRGELPPVQALLLAPELPEVQLTWEDGWRLPDRQPVEALGPCGVAACYRLADGHLVLDGARWASFGERLQAGLAQRGIGPDEFAERWGVDPEEVGRWLADSRLPGPGEIGWLVDLLAVWEWCYGDRDGD